MGLFNKVEEDTNVTVNTYIGDFTPTFDGAEKEFYFHFCGKMNQGHILETPERQPIYEAELVKFSLLGKSDYDFIDHVKNVSTHHLIGKTSTVSTGHTGLFGGTVSSVVSSTFTLDGGKLYEVLKLAGYTADTKAALIGMATEYTIGYKGQQIGVIKAAGTSIVPGVKANKLTENLISPGLFKVYCSIENAPIMFLWCLQFGRSEQRITD